MSQVQSATAESAKVTARGRQTVADPIPAPATPAGADVNFASVFAMTRESAWMDSLRSRQGEAAARHAQQGRTRMGPQQKHQEPAGQGIERGLAEHQRQAQIGIGRDPGRE